MRGQRLSGKSGWAQGFWQLKKGTRDCSPRPSEGNRGSERAHPSPGCPAQQWLLRAEPCTQLPARVASLGTKVFADVTREGEAVQGPVPEPSGSDLTGRGNLDTHRRERSRVDGASGLGEHGSSLHRSRLSVRWVRQERPSLQLAVAVLPQVDAGRRGEGWKAEPGMF